MRFITALWVVVVLTMTSSSSSAQNMDAMVMTNHRMLMEIINTMKESLLPAVQDMKEQQKDQTKGLLHDLKEEQIEQTKGLLDDLKEEQIEQTKGLLDDTKQEQIEQTKSLLHEMMEEQTEQTKGLLQDMKEELLNEKKEELRTQTKDLLNEMIEEQTEQTKGLLQDMKEELLNARCPDGWTYFNSHCYYISTDTASWEESSRRCRATFGSQLASIANSAENEFIKEILSHQDGRSHFWLGLHNDLGRGDWRWMDGTDINGFTNWSRNQPDNYRGVEHCGEIHNAVRNWNDDNCTKSNYFICKFTVNMKEELLNEMKEELRTQTKDLLNEMMEEQTEQTKGLLQDMKDEQTEQTKGLLQDMKEELLNDLKKEMREQTKNLLKAKCPDGWTYFNNHCYYISSDHASWEEASRRCRATFGSQLASIANSAENEFIKEIISHLDDNSRFWLGLHNDFGRGDWRWMDGTDINGFTYWSPSQPDNTWGTEHCGEIWQRERTWNDDQCSISKNFICKFTVK